MLIVTYLTHSGRASLMSTQPGSGGGIFSVFSVVPSPRSPLRAPHSALTTFSPNGFIQSTAAAHSVSPPATSTFTFRPVCIPVIKTPTKQSRKPAA